MPVRGLTRERPFQSSFHMHATRALKKHSVTRFQKCAEKFTRLLGSVEERRGAARQSRCDSFVHYPASGAAYADDGMNTLLRGESSDVAVQGPGLAAKLQHFSEHGNAPRCRSIPKQCVR